MNTYLILALGFLQIVDGAITYYAVSRNLAVEANPFAKLVFNFLGLGFSIALLKLLIVAFIVWLFTERKKMNHRPITAVLLICTAVYTFVAINNFYLVFFR